MPRWEKWVTKLQYTNLTPAMAAGCGTLELQCFPHADPEELISESDFSAYARIFPAGCFVCLDDDRVVGQAAGIFIDFDFEHAQHSIVVFTGVHKCGNHDPNGDWYYGTDMAVHPDYRRRGIGHQLYELRKKVVTQWGKRGIILGGHIPCYADHKHELSAEEYVTRVVAGDLYDPTLSFQLGNGFEVRGVLENYLADEAIDGWAALLVWENKRMYRSSERS